MKLTQKAQKVCIKAKLKTTWLNVSSDTQTAPDKWKSTTK